MTIRISAYKNRDSDHTITVLDVNGNAATLQATDLIRLKIGRTGKAPILDLNNVDPPPSGSHLTPRTNPCTLKLMRADLDAMTPGIYDLEVGVVDDSDSDRMKHADKGIFALHGTQAGSVANV